MGIDDALGYMVDVSAIARELNAAPNLVSHFLTSLEPEQYVSGFKLVITPEASVKTENGKRSPEESKNHTFTITFNIFPEQVEVVDPDANLPEEVSNPTITEEPAPVPEPPVEVPQPTAWQVWMYLERERTNTFQCIGTFDAEWKAHRCIAEAERANNNKLRIHYEIHPTFDEIPSEENTESNPPETELIEVEIISDPT